MIITKDGLKLLRHEGPDPVISEILHDPYILENLSESMSYTTEMPANICFSIEKEGISIGQVCLKNIRWINHKAEISLFIAKEEQGKGYGWKALQAIVEYGFKRMNFYRLEAEIVDKNQASLKLVEKLGFREEGRLREAKFIDGEYRDLLRFGILRREYLNPE